ncbi:MAG: deoxyguanosinetriphosphate triphosphohydrolase [Burkholderiales bacterium]
MTLAAYACWPQHTRGRLHPELAAPTRDEFQRDRDRIVHSSAFRRLVYKTQVFLNHEGDLFRTRLTHSLEVAQLGRSMARNLGLNEDLVEAIALAHDLGHTPFGHAGQDALNECMASHGGFEHNLQSLRVVDELEQRYPDYNGLNLCFETREGILKHCSLRNAEKIEAQEPSGVARRFITRSQPSLEAQLCNLADEIAYNAHDVDDGVRSGLLTLAQLRSVPLFEAHYLQTLVQHPQLAEPTSGRRLLYGVIRRMLSAQVYDLIDHTRAALAQARPASVEAVRQLPTMVGFSATMQQQSAALKRFLLVHLYRHPQVVQTTDHARTVVRELFAAYQGGAEPPRSPREVADYIAGMTDRFALREHERITGRKLL